MHIEPMTIPYGYKGIIQHCVCGAHETAGVIAEVLTSGKSTNGDPEAVSTPFAVES